MSRFIGRREPLGRLTAAYQAVADPGRPASGWAGVVLVTGEAGIGKTALLTRFTADVTVRGATVVWGTAWDGDQAPAWWPWTQALRALLHRRDEEPSDPDLAAVLPQLPGAHEPAASGGASQIRTFDAVHRLLSRAAADAPVVVILDDLHWADRSTVDLMRYLSHQRQPAAVLLVGAYRPHQRHADIAGPLADLVAAAELLALRGLSADEVADLVTTIAGDAGPAGWARLVHERSGGHPFFARELCHLLAAGGTARQVPAAIREVIGRRVGHLSVGCRALLDAAAVVGTVWLPDVLSDVTGDAPPVVTELAGEAAAASILVSAGGPDGATRFAHDLYRETIYTNLPAARRLDLHHRVATALSRRHKRGSPVFPAELARHHAAAVALTGPAPALRWARAAADADTAQFAFADAAGHLARARAAVADAGQPLTDAELVDLLVREADLRLRAGDAGRSRELLDTAWTRAVPTAEPALLGAVALGLDRMGARFAMPRNDLIAVLETARDAAAGRGNPDEAQVTAALARQLQHSVPADRPRARPLAEHAVAIARRLDDPATLASCLLAQHDVLWTPGTGIQRAEIAAEIAELAQRAADPQRHAQALLLSATAQLENGSAAFRATFTAYRYVTEQLHEPRHDYLLRTRLAALALLDGDMEAGERLSAEAACLGDTVADSDTGNVRMSQRLEIARARADPAELRDTAAAAVRWWVGAPVHAHAVAAGFYARSGDLAAARRELDIVQALGGWRGERSYLRSVFVGELSAAAIAINDRPLCTQLLEDLLPLGDTCAVNAALVCFMGAHAHRIGLLHAALGDRDAAGDWLSRALETHRRLGAAAWEAESRDALASLGSSHPRPAGAGPARTLAELPRGAQLLLIGDMWQASYRDHTAFLRDVKGLHDLAALLARPGTDVAALDLAGDPALPPEPASRQPVLDRSAVHAYRRRLADLDEELDAARAMSDFTQQQRATDEREHLLAELRHASRPGGGSRPLGPSAAERARKAVTARIRDAIRRITGVHPDLGIHLDRTIRTGTTCRYEPAQDRSSPEGTAPTS